MKRTVTTDAKIEEIEFFGSSVVFTCLTPRRRNFSTTVTFDDGASPRAASFKKWLLLCAMADAYGIDLTDMNADRLCQLRRFYGCFFRFRLIEWKGNWLIDKFRRCDPFEVSDGIAELEAYLEEVGHVL